MNIIITLPSDISWEDYKKELSFVEDETNVMNYKVGRLPKTVEIGDKCFLVHKGFIKGWMKICGMKEHGFKCSTTGKYWEGNFIQRTGKFNYIEPISMTGFQNFRYTKLD